MRRRSCGKPVSVKCLSEPSRINACVVVVWAALCGTGLRTAGVVVRLTCATRENLVRHCAACPSLKRQMGTINMAMPMRPCHSLLPSRIVVGHGQPTAGCLIFRFGKAYCVCLSSSALESDEVKVSLHIIRLTRCSVWLCYFCSAHDSLPTIPR